MQPIYSILSHVSLPHDGFIPTLGVYLLVKPLDILMDVPTHFSLLSLQSQLRQISASQILVKGTLSFDSLEICCLGMALFEVFLVAFSNNIDGQGHLKQCLCSLNKVVLSDSLQMRLNNLFILSVKPECSFADLIKNKVS